MTAERGGPVTAAGKALLAQEFDHSNRRDRKDFTAKVRAIEHQAALYERRVWSRRAESLKTAEAIAAIEREARQPLLAALAEWREARRAILPLSTQGGWDTHRRLAEAESRLSKLHAAITADATTGGGDWVAPDYGTTVGRVGFGEWIKESGE